MFTQILQKIKSFKVSLGIFIAFIILYLVILAIVGLNRPAWGDEAHFVQTVQQFGQGITLDVLRSYGEMSTPFPFVMYALWGRLFGFSLPALRTLSLAIALITAGLFWWLCYKIFREAFSTSICTIFLFINPYMIGFSIFVFPDMVTILCLVLGMLAMLDDRPVALCLACAFGLLSRQYFIFFPLAVFFYTLYNHFRRGGNPIKTITAIALSVLPTLWLFWLWKGVSPQNNLGGIYLGYAFTFHPTALILYIILLGAYLSPLVLIRWRKYYLSPPIMVIAVIASLTYFVFPLKASTPSLNAGITTVGYLDRALSAILGPYTKWAWYSLFLLSLPILIQIIHVWFKNLRQPGAEEWISLAILLFLVIMPFSYLWWEKYFVLVLPLAILEIFRPAHPTKYRMPLIQ